jgi:type I restriction enzyme S subunit
MSRTASVGFVTMMGRPMATSQDFVNWVCGPDLDPFFLAYALRASRTYLRGLSSGAVHKTIYMPTLHALQVCMPPLNEQRRIVAALDARIAEAERLRAALAARLAEIETLPASILRAAFAPGAGPGAAPPAPAPGPAGHSRPELVHA